jgi:DNA-binding phage protein
MAEPHLGRHAIVFHDDEVVQLLRAAVEREGNQIAFARRHGLSRAHLNMILNGKRSVTEKVTKALGLRMVYVAE